MYNSETQSIVFEHIGNNSYKLYFDPEADHSCKLYITVLPEGDSVGLTAIAGDATVWYIEHYGINDPDSTQRITVYCMVNNAPYYLCFIPQRLAGDFTIYAVPANGSVMLPYINATPAIDTDADISLLYVSRPGISGIDEFERSKGALELIKNAEMIADEYGSRNNKTVNVYCGELNAEHVLEALDHSQYIVLRGHGSQGILYFTEDSNQNLKITSTEISNSGMNFEQAEIVLIGACYSGADFNGVNLVDAIHGRYAQNVIGFREQLNRSLFSAYQWLFFERYKEYVDGDQTYPSVEEIAVGVYSELNNPANWSYYGISTDHDNPIISGNIEYKGY